MQNPRSSSLAVGRVSVRKSRSPLSRAQKVWDARFLKGEGQPEIMSVVVVGPLHLSPSSPPNDMSPTVPPRRSTRVSPAQNKEDNKLSSSQPAKPKAKAPSAKKRGPLESPNATRAMTSPARKGQGKLSLFTEAPLDVLFEVFSHLEPLDLLRMTRTTKTLRFLLLDRSSIAAWHSAFKKIEGLPPVLEGFSEPQYANLIFDNHCHNCYEATTKDILWQVRIRLCKECLDKGTIMATEERLRQLHLLGDVENARDLLPITPSFNYVRRRVWRNISYYEIITWKRLVQEGAPLRRGSPEYATWLSEKQKEHEALVASYSVHEKWFDSRAELRLEGIIARLRADGWNELSHVHIRDLLQSHPLVNVPEVLTDSTWDSIRPSLTEVMAKVRADALKSKVECAIKLRVQTLKELVGHIFAKLPETPHNPPATALCIYQPFLDIIKNTPPEAGTDNKLKEALGSVPDLCEKWRQEQSARLKAMLQKKKGRSDDLSLVVNAFTCVDCSSPTVLHYPHFASHACFFSTASVGDTQVEVWSGKAISVLTQDVYNRCVGVVRDCGLDPNTATAEDMDAADVFFRCEECESSEGKKSVRLMRWRTAMNHHHPAGVARVDDEELIALGRRKEKSMFDEELSWPVAHKAYHWTFVCVHCNMEESSPTARAEHLRSVHGIDGASTMADHYRRSFKYTNLNQLSVMVEFEGVDT